MTFQVNDGGRAAAGFKGSAGDCVTRALAIAMDLPYAEVYEAMAYGNAHQDCKAKSGWQIGRKSARNGIDTSRQWFKDFMMMHGWRWVPTMGIGTGCKIHLRKEELPSGRIIARMSKHLCAVIDGVIHDTQDPSRGGTRCVYGYWEKR